MANSTYTNDSWEKPLLSLRIRNITVLGNGLLRQNRDCDSHYNYTEESSIGICHMRMSTSIRDIPTICYSMTLVKYLIVLNLWLILFIFYRVDNFWYLLIKVNRKINESYFCAVTFKKMINSLYFFYSLLCAVVFETHQWWSDYFISHWHSCSCE